MPRTQDALHEKGFDMSLGSHDEDALIDPDRALEYANIRVGLKNLKDPLTDINFYKKVNARATKEQVLKTIADNDQEQMRELSDFFYGVSGIYSRLCRYMAYLYRYDWVVTPVVIDDKVNKKKITEGFYKSLMYLDDFKAKESFGNIALKVMRHGAYYGYKVDQGNTVAIQELPVKYCRSRFMMGNKPVVEFNMRYFDDTFTDTQMRIRILGVFPPEFRKGYIQYKEGKLPIDFMGDQSGWYMLDYKQTVKFNMHGSDAPSLISVIPAIIDLEEAKELDRKKMQQQLLKIIIQKMPIDKNGELIFDVDEARALHTNAVKMLGDAVGINVLTTFAEVDVQDMADKSATSQYDETNKVERAVFNEAGISQMQFNTTGNLALEKSIANDEASMFTLVAQFETFLNEILEPFNRNPKKLRYTVQILGTTIYNYQALAKLYSDQMKVGFSKILPQIALGQSQSSIMATAYFENEVLDLNSLFVPPPTSNTTAGGEDKAPKEDKPTGRPKLDPDKQSDKTRQNNESMS